MKLCVPSWQLPGSWLYNAEKLVDLSWIEGIELLFFSFDDETRKLFAAEREALASLAERFSFSLHLPDPLRPADLDLVEMTESFVDSYVFHPRGIDSSSLGYGEERDWAALVREMRAAYGRERFAMEYTGEKAFEKSLELLPDLSLCADTGCLLRDGKQPLDWIRSHAGSLREIHLHAARGNKDHFALGPDDAWLPDLAKAAGESGWRIVLETFSLEESRASYDELRRWLP